MKKKILIVVSIILALGLVSFTGNFIYQKLRVKNAKIDVKLKENLETEFLSKIKVSDFITSINGTIVDDYEIDTTKVGLKKIDFTFVNEDKIRIDYSYELNIVDKVAPVVWLGNSYNVYLGNEVNLTDKILCGDNYDNKPVCEIIGEYDINKEGSYPLVFKATDNGGNITEKEFKLNVLKPKTGTSTPNNSNNNKEKTLFSDVVKEYKTDNTQIGIDISHWQGNIDFEKLKNAGVEFVIIRVGRTKGIGGDYVLDDKFVQNITKANEVGIPAGIYFYSYANSKDQALKDANWVLEQIKNYKIDLPIAFDWENWSTYNDYALSFFGLTDMANSFLDVFKTSGYDGLLYSSKNYLEDIWLDSDYPVWLAHYVKKTTYKKDFLYWQICNNGRVDGISGDVDIDIRYID